MRLTRSGGLSCAFIAIFFIISLGALAAALGGCQGCVKKADFDSAIGELRANDQRRQQEIGSLSQQMQQRLAAYGAKIAPMKGGVRGDAAAHFAFNEATLRDEDEPLLDDFAKVVSGNSGDSHGGTCNSSYMRLLFAPCPLRQGHVHERLHQKAEGRTAV